MAHASRPTRDGQGEAWFFPPGTGWSYSGTNYLMLGLIVEETTGATLREELKRRIVEPSRLEATDLPERLAPVNGLARGSSLPTIPCFRDFERRRDRPRPPIRWAGGGVVSTARDVARFLQALLKGELLPAAPAQRDADDGGLRLAKVRRLRVGDQRDDDFDAGADVMRPCLGPPGILAGISAMPSRAEDSDRRL